MWQKVVFKNHPGNNDRLGGGGGSGGGGIGCG